MGLKSIPKLSFFTLKQYKKTVVKKLRLLRVTSLLSSCQKEVTAVTGHAGGTKMRHEAHPHQGVSKLSRHVNSIQHVPFAERVEQCFFVLSLPFLVAPFNLHLIVIERAETARSPGLNTTLDWE